MLTVERVVEAVERLRRQGTDDAWCEAKACADGLGRSVWESVSAFANTSGGLLLLGLDEREGFAPVPSFDASGICDRFVEGMGSGGVAGAKLVNPPHYELARVEVDGSCILAAEIAENDFQHKPCYIAARGILGGSYRRLDDKDVRLSPTELYEMQGSRTPSDADRAAVPDASLSDLDDGLLERFLEWRAGSRALRGARTREDKLRRLNILDVRGEVRFCGLLCFGVYPQQFAPGATIDVAVHPGTQKGQVAGVRFTDRIVCEGPLGEMVDQAVCAVMRNLRTASLVVGTGRADVPEIPEEVVREAVANAVVHREYDVAFLGQAVSVDVFRDRIVVTSPGGLWGGKTLDTLADGTSRCRNLMLMQLLRDAPREVGLGATVEGQGTGVGLMIHAMEGAGLPAPRFYAGLDQFAVVLDRPYELAPGTDDTGRPVVVRVPWPQADAPDGGAGPDPRKFYPAGFGESWEQEGARFRLAGTGRAPDGERMLFRPAGGDTVWEVHGTSSAERPPRRTVRPVVDRSYLLVKDGWVLKVLSETDPKGIREIAEEGGKSLSVARRAVRELAEAGRVVPTAPPTSRNRKYLLARAT